MKVQFHCVHDAKDYYEVLSDGAALFCGTRGECRRYIALHREKVLRSESERAARRSAASWGRRARRIDPVSVRKRGVRVAL